MSFHRSQVIVRARATMSTLWSWSFGRRSAVVITRSSTLSGSPKIAWATARSTSMSKPSIRPVTGLRAPSSSESAETPAMRRPRSWIRRIVVLAGIWPGVGMVAGGAYD